MAVIDAGDKREAIHIEGLGLIKYIIEFHYERIKTL